MGVTSVKQADGTELATEIHIFPEELRGLGEGSYMMNLTAGGDNNRMTNGRFCLAHDERNSHSTADVEWQCYTNERITAKYNTRVMTAK